MASKKHLLRTTVERDISQADAVRGKRWTMTAEAKEASGPGRAGRMSRRRKRDAVLRLLRGEDLEMVSRSLGVTAATLAAWRDALPEQAEPSVRSEPTACQRLLVGRDLDAGQAGSHHAFLDKNGA